MRDSGDAGRAARAAAAVGALASRDGLADDCVGTLALLSGATSGATSAAGLRREVSRLTARLTRLIDADHDGGVPQPDDDDLAGMAAPFEASPHVRPRRGADYRHDATRGLAAWKGGAGTLPRLSAPGLYRAHLSFCAPCAGAEARGTYDAACPHKIHVWCALAEGFWLPWRGGAPPPAAALADPRPVPSYRLDSPDADEAARARAAVAEFDKYERLGVFRRLSDAEAADPAKCATVTRTAVVFKAKLKLPPEVQADVDRTGGAYTTAVVCAAARRDGEADAAAYSDSVRCAQQAHVRVDNELLFEQATAARRKEPKARLIAWHHRTVNPHLIPTSLRYGTIADLMGGAGPGWVLRTDDGSSAYYQLPPRADAEPYLVVEHPVTRARYVMVGGPMGLSAMPLMFAGEMAVIRRAIAASPPARRGEAHVSGYLDDTAQAVAPVAQAEQWRWADGVFEEASFLRNEKGESGTSVTYLGGQCDTVTGVARVKADKLYQTLHHAAFLHRLAVAGGGGAATDAPSFVGVDLFRSFCGDVTWLCEFDAALRPHSQGLYAALTAADRGGYRAVKLDTTSPAYADLAFISRRAADGNIRGAAHFAREQAAVRLTTRRLRSAPRALRRACRPSRLTARPAPACRRCCRRCRRRRAP